MQSTIKLYQKIPDDYSRGEDDIVSLYEILVNQHWAEQDKMWGQKYTGMICLLTYLYTNTLTTVGNYNNLNIKNPSKKLLLDTKINNSCFKMLIKQQKSARLLFFQDIKG